MPENTGAGKDRNRPNGEPLDSSRLDNVLLNNARLNAERIDRVDLIKDRRRNARFACGGEAKISRLPSEGVFSPGKILDLSLGGCLLDTTLPVIYGSRTEVVLRVNDSTFRAVGEVRTLRSGAGAGIEFVQLSSGGKDLLADLIHELARLQAAMNKLKSTRRDTNADSFRMQLEDGKQQARRLGNHVAALRSVLSSENRLETSGGDSIESLDESSNENSKPIANVTKIAEQTTTAQGLVITVDLFG